MRYASLLLWLAIAGDSHCADMSAPLRISSNGHYLVSQSGIPVFLMADTAWSLVNRLKREEMTTYLEKRRAQSFNAVTFVLYSTGDANQGDTGLNAYDQAPFQMKEGRPDPTQPRLTPGANPSDGAEYDYWDHVDFALAETKRLGLFAIVLPCWGSAVCGKYDGSPDGGIIFDPSNARTYGRWLGGRYRAEPHVLWMLGGDRSARYEKTGQDYRPIFRAMGEGLHEAAKDALISFHPQKRAPQSGDWFHADEWLTFNSIQHWPEDQVRIINRDWNAKPAKPTWIFEGRYEGYYKNGYKAEDWGEWQCRQQAWQTVFAGAFGHTYGHERVFGFGKDGWDWWKKLEDPGARCMTHLVKFIAELRPGEYLARVPDQNLIDGDAGKAERLKSNRITAMRTEDKRLAFVYSAQGRAVRIKLAQLAAVKFAASWFNPRTGKWHAGDVESDDPKAFASDIQGGPGTPVREFVPPTHGDGQDWVLMLRS